MTVGGILVLVLGIMMEQVMAAVKVSSRGNWTTIAPVEGMRLIVVKVIL